VTPEEVVRVAKKYLIPEHVNVAVMGCEAKDKPEGPAAPVAAKVDEKKADAERLNAELEVLKKDPNVEKASLLTDRGVFEFILKGSGIRVVLKEDRSLP